MGQGNTVRPATFSRRLLMLRRSVLVLAALVLASFGDAPAPTALEAPSALGRRDDEIACLILAIVDDAAGLSRLLDMQRANAQRLADDPTSPSPVLFQLGRVDAYRDSRVSAERLRMLILERLPDLPHGTPTCTVAAPAGHGH